MLKTEGSTLKTHLFFTVNSKTTLYVNEQINLNCLVGNAKLFTYTELIYL